MNCLPTKRGAVAPFRKHKQVSLVLCLFLFSLLSFSAFAQTKVTGRVSSGDTSLSDVTVQVKGTTTGTSTNAEGKFSIDAPANATLVFSHINYAAMEIGVNNRTTINVVLTSNNATLTDVVVVGYNSQRKATLTGSISTVKGADLVKSPQPNVSNSLAGRFSGMIINNRGGEPGYDGSAIYIRGLATTGNNDVLIVVDGVPGQIGGLERLNPNDIESLTVLKDASAAIYGSRAANGVILITTKRGRSGKPMISASFNQGFSSPTRLPKMADAATYATIMNEITYYTNKAGGMNQQYSATELQKFADGSDPLNYANTDWADLTLKKSAAQSQANVSVNGGSENIRYYVSAGALYQDGIYKNGATKYKQYSFRSNIDANITKGFKVALYLSGREENRQFPMVSAGSIFRSIYRAFPTVPAFFPNGLPSYGIEGSNPPVMATDIGGLNKNPTQVFNGVLKGSYDIAPVKGLSIDGFYAIDKLWSFSKAFSQPYILYKYDRTTDVYSKQVMGGANQLATLSESQRNQSQTTANIKLNFKRGFGGHNIDAFVGYEQSEFKAEEFGAYRENFPSTQTPELSQGGAAAADKNNYGGSYHYTRKSYLGKLGYNYHDKYLAEVQMRIDGSSIFPKGNQYGYFPSVSAGWRISKESFFNVGFIDDLKLRASYGQLGNDNVELFQYLNNYSLNSQLVLGSNVVSGIDLTKLANEKITWETARKTDIGLEAVILKKFFIELIYFQQKRSDILTKRNASIPFVTGIVNPYGSSSLVPDENIGKVDSKGFEATLGYNNKTRNGFSYGISGNITYAKSKVIFLDEASGMLAYQRREGHPLNTYVLYNAIGIFRTDDDLSKYKQVNGNGNQLGDLIYEDYNKDGKISADDQVRTKYGNIPEITYGVLLNAGYKNFDIVAVFSGQTNVSQYVLPESGNVGNFYSSWADNRWSPTNTAGSYPRVDTRASASVNGGQYPNTFWLNDASFIRLKNVELGYNLSPEWLKRTKMEGFRVYLNAFNLFTITKVKDYDPEGSNGSGQFYPQQRIINVGVNVYF